jgi:alpha-galactosidase
MYPKKYTNYKQTNINLMVEFVGQTINENGKSYFVVPAIQFIINSQARVDLAYRQELVSSMLRTAPNGAYLNLEYTFLR